MKRSTASFVLVLSASFFSYFALPPAAHASSYGVSGSGGGYSGSGTLTATDQGDGSYLITDGSGTGFQGIIGVGGFNGNDNLLFPNAAQYVDGSGFSFTVSGYGDTDNVNIFWDGSEYQAYIVDEGGNVMEVPVTFNLTANPTPQIGRLVQFALSPQFSSQLSGGSTQFSFSFSPNLDPPTDPTPEPSSLALMGTGAVALALLVRWRMRACLQQ